MILAKDIQALPSKILIAPLNWGLGHASRCIPIIQGLLGAAKSVQIASDGEALVFLKRAFPEITLHELPSYNIQYKHNSIELNVLLQSAKMLKAIRREKKRIAEIVEQENIEYIISDNRYGVRHPNIKSIILTHQISLQSSYKLFSKSGTLINKRWIQQFDECWIPDFPDHRLSGLMSKASLNIPMKFIGPLTRIRKEKLPEKNDILAIVSGPEPMRSMFSKQLYTTLSSLEHQSILIEGRVEEKVKKTIDRNLTRYNFLDSKKLNTLINESKVIICRSGYSSIMDLCELDKKVVLIPTPGQTEQVYLAGHLDKQYGFHALAERDLESQGKKLLAELLKK